MNAQATELVSVIIPVYNVQTYLERCINSVLTQTYKNIQIILIDDGSTDSSGEICDVYANKYPQIEVIHQVNGGISSARNIGLTSIKGQWVSFLDADDYLSKSFVEQTLNACLQHDADIAICKQINVSKEQYCEEQFTIASNYECITGREAAIRHFGKEAFLLNVAISRLSRASLWNDLRFPSGKIIEDVFVSHQLLYQARKIVIQDSRLYAYCLSPDSIMRSSFTSKRLDALDAWWEAIRFFEQIKDNALLDIAWRVYCNRLFDAYGICKNHLPDNKEIHKQLRQQAISAYRKVKHTYSYIDLSAKRAIAYRGKQFIGRYFPNLYTSLFLKNRTYI